MKRFYVWSHCSSHVLSLEIKLLSFRRTWNSMEMRFPHSSTSGFGQNPLPFNPNILIMTRSWEANWVRPCYVVQLAKIVHVHIAYNKKDLVVLYHIIIRGWVTRPLVKEWLTINWLCEIWHLRAIQLENCHFELQDLFLESLAFQRYHVSLGVIYPLTVKSTKQGRLTENCWIFSAYWFFIS